jgi:cleavage stimulation factor subunit 3
LQVLATGCAVLNTDGQGSMVLQFARASLLERLKRTKESKGIWNALSTESPSPLVHIQHMRFARRCEGMKGARKVFANARKRGGETCTWRVYVAAALLEFYSNKNVKVAGNIFELGLKKFPECVPFISQYVKFLSGLNDEAPLRVLVS